jgi:hypothetical protein
MITNLDLLGLLILVAIIDIILAKSNRAAVSHHFRASPSHVTVPTPECNDGSDS